MATMTHPPVTLHQATTLEPDQQLRHLADHHSRDEADRITLLTHLALASAVQTTWLRMTLPLAHRALVAGARMDEVAAAVGTRTGAVASAWLRWAQQESASGERLRLNFPWATRSEIDTIVARHPDLWPGGAE